MLQIIVAERAGTCMGVKSAIQLAEELRCPILGPLVHNPRVVADLAARGIRILERETHVEQLKGLHEVILTAHGFPRGKKEALIRSGMRVHDATCPVLRKAVYRKIARLEHEGYSVVLVGNPRHAEIAATRSYGTDIPVVYSSEEARALPAGLGRVAAICQTTITKATFDEICRAIRERYPDLLVVDTRCGPVRRQQEGVASLASRVEAMLIIGGRNSSNTSNLVRIAKEFLPAATYHIEHPEEIQPSWIEGINRLGIGAGTSTPHEQILEVIHHVRTLCGQPVQVIQEGEGSEMKFEETGLL